MVHQKFMKKLTIPHFIYFVFFVASSMKSTYSAVMVPTSYGVYSPSYVTERFPYVYDSEGWDIRYAPYIDGTDASNQVTRSTGGFMIGWIGPTFDTVGLMKYRAFDLQSYFSNSSSQTFVMDVLVNSIWLGGSSYTPVENSPDLALLASVDWYVGNWDFNSNDLTAIGNPIGDIAINPDTSKYTANFGFETSNLDLSQATNSIQFIDPNAVVVFRFYKGSAFPIHTVGIRTTAEDDLGPAIGSIPEPSALFLLALATTGIMTRRRR
jgi:hypothetical protein